MEKITLKKSKYSLSGDLVTYLIVAVLFVVFSLLSDGISLFGQSLKLSRSTKGLLIPICVYVTAAVALNLVVGISGELSLGHAGFMSLGAFSGAVFCHVFAFIPNDILRLLAAMLCAGLVAAFFGVIIGIPVLRLQGDYLAIVTLAFGEIIMNLLNCVYLGYDSAGWHFSFGKSLTLLDGGTSVLTGPMGVTGNQKLSTFTVGCILVLFALFVVLNLIRSKTGRAIMAIRDNRIAAESVGLSAGKYKMIAFTLSAFLTGMAGALYIMNYASVAPAKFNFNTSILLLVFVVLGGMGNIRGSVIAAILLTVLPEKLRALGDYRMLIYAVILIAMMLLTNASWGKRIIADIGSLFKGKQNTDKEGK